MTNEASPQIVELPRLGLKSQPDPDPARSQRAMAAMLQMKKLDIAALHRAYVG